MTRDLTSEALSYSGGRGLSTCPISGDPVWSAADAVGETTAWLERPWWQPDASGIDVQTLPAFDSIYADAADILAWPRGEPGRFFMRTGALTHLGDLGGVGPVLLHPHPKSWAEDGGNGVCVLAWDRMAPRLRLAKRPLRCVGAKFTEWVRVKIEAATPKMPAIGVARDGR